MTGKNVSMRVLQITWEADELEQLFSVLKVWHFK